MNFSLSLLRKIFSVCVCSLTLLFLSYFRRPAPWFIQNPVTEEEDFIQVLEKKRSVVGVGVNVDVNK